MKEVSVEPPLDPSGGHCLKKRFIYNLWKQAKMQDREQHLWSTTIPVKTKKKWSIYTGCVCGEWGSGVYIWKNIQEADNCGVCGYKNRKKGSEEV